MTPADLYDLIYDSDVYFDDEPQIVQLDWIEEAERQEALSEDDYLERIERDGYLTGTVLG